MLKTIRNVIITVVILLGLFAAAGLAYVKFSSDSKPNQQTTNTNSEEQNYTTPKPKKPGPKSRVSAAIESLLSPVKAGANTSMTIHTLPTAKCTIIVTYDKERSKDSGLSPKIADDYGTATWSWTVDKSAPTGTWPVKVTCFYNKLSAVVVGNLKVTK